MLDCQDLLFGDVQAIATSDEKVRVLSIAIIVFVMLFPSSFLVSQWLCLFLRSTELDAKYVGLRSSIPSLNRQSSASSHS